MYPLQLLTRDMPLATILGMSATAQLWAMVYRGSAQAASLPCSLGTPVLHMGTKYQYPPLDQGIPASRQDEEEVADIDDTPKESPHKSKRTEGH